MRAALLAIALTGLTGLTVVGCDADDPRESAWIEVAAASFVDGEESEIVTIPAQGDAAALALRVTTSPGVCFQLSALVDAGGNALIEGRSPGTFCRDCSLRSSVALEAGVFVLPAERVALDGELALRFGRVDCETLTPLHVSAGEDRPPLVIDAQPILAEPEHAIVDLRFLVAADSILADDPARQQELLAALGEELGPAGLEPRLVAVVDLDAPDTPDHALRFHAGDHGDLAAQLQGLPPRAESTIDVVFAGCLLYDDPIFGPPRALEGYTPRIPGGAGPADAVFIPGVDCLAPDTGPLDIPVRTQAHLLAHELGHYLGLYHAVEADGLEDMLDDTDADNLMHFRPGLASSVGLSPAQGRVMRTHPAARTD
ncbi:MAG: hypothetical protein KC457_01930 [Myxococcales bacterium]|nr:hypothetical protein [Myxococcales bacterium]